MKKSTIWCALVCCLLFILMGCQGSEETTVDSGSPSTQVEKSFDFTMSAYPSQKAAANQSSETANFTADQIMNGQLKALNTDTSTSQTFDWSIYFNETTFEVQSNKTIILTPANYEFSLLLTKGDYQYAGTAVQEIVDGTADVSMTIRPIIGNTVTDVSVVGELADFKFQYDPDELSTVGFTAPQLGVTVDGGAENIFALNPATGISNSYINLSAGAHQIQLKLYDGSIQRGKSLTAQETVVVSSGLDIVMDLVALHGETTFTLTEAGGDATFQFTVPAEVVEEAGGIANLETLFSLVGPKNSLQETVLNLAENGSGDYEGQVTLSGLQFDAITFSLAFNDISKSPKDLLGSCNESVTLDTTQRTVNCGISLSIRAIATGNLLATLGVNVFNEYNEPMAGATIYNGETILGITGSGTFGTVGYLKVYLNSGNYLIRAEASSMFGEENVSLPPLGVVNEDVTLNRLFGEIIVDTISGNTTENGGTALFSIRLNDQPTHEVALDFSSSDTTEGTVSPSSLTFDSSNWDTEQAVTITGVDDIIPDGDIVYSIILAASVSDDTNFDGIDPTDITIVNIDNDPHLPDTGQTISYTLTFGEDHDYLINLPSYTDNGNGTVTDNNTSLIWQKSDDNATRTWYNAVSYCQNLNLGGYSDWRLPFIKELQSIVDYGKSSPAVNTSFFPGTNDRYWSSTDLATDSNRAWYLVSANGFIEAYYKDQYNIYYARCVRGGNGSDLWPHSYSVNGNGTVTHQSTGLIWQQQDDNTRRSWENGISYCESLTFGGNNDWRLPNTKELYAIANHSVMNPSINSLVFPNTDRYYWTSTTYSVANILAYTVDFSNGSLAFFDGMRKTNSLYIRCVRGGL